MPHLPRLAVTPGEPAGIGPDLVLRLAQRSWDAELVAVADPALLRRRARELAIAIELHELDGSRERAAHTPGTLAVLPVVSGQAAQAGVLDVANAAYVLETLGQAVKGCLRGAFDALVTGPVHKGIVNRAGLAFTGHTELLAELAGGLPVMLLAAGELRVALATTHLPLAAVSQAISAQRLREVIRVLDRDLRQRFRLRAPRVLVCGLNPHAGESGYLGREEIEVIEPTLAALRGEGLDLLGPLPADTVFTPHCLAGADAVLAMYHDQGLPVLKHVGFGHAVNVTLGLPIIRTSVDHGTALELAGTGKADPGSLHAAIDLAIDLCRSQHEYPAAMNL